MPEELTLEPADGLCVRWDLEAVAGYGTAETVPESAWTLEGSLTPSLSALRVLSAATSEGSVLLLVAARPRDAVAHDDEAVRAVLVDPERDVTPIEEAFLSTEYAGDGTVRRIGLELHKEGDAYPVRGAGDAESTWASEHDGFRRESAALRFRLDGRAGAALYEILRS